MPDYYVKDNFCEAGSINGDLDWFVVEHLCESVDNDKDRVIAVAFSIGRDKQPRDIIH